MSRDTVPQPFGPDPSNSAQAPTAQQSGRQQLFALLRHDETGAPTEDDTQSKLRARTRELSDAQLDTLQQVALKSLQPRGA